VLKTNHHLDEEDIEKYSMGDLGEPAISLFEEHLLICESCQDRVAQSDRYVPLVQSASAEIRRKNAKWADRSRWLFPRWTPAFAAAALLFSSALGLQWFARRQASNNQPPVAISLAATRGNGFGSKAPAGRALTLQLDFTAMPASESYRLELVDSRGKRVWQGGVNPQDTHGAVSIPGLSRGLYFLRAYAPTGDLLREYGLEVASQ